MGVGDAVAGDGNADAVRARRGPRADGGRGLLQRVPCCGADGGGRVDVESGRVGHFQNDSVPSGSNEHLIGRNIRGVGGGGGHCAS